MIPWTRAIVAGRFDPVDYDETDLVLAASQVARETVVLMSRSDNPLLSLCERDELVRAMAKSHPRIGGLVSTALAVTARDGDVLVSRTTDTVADLAVADVLVVPRPARSGGAAAREALASLLDERSNKLVALVRLRENVPAAVYAPLLRLVAHRVSWEGNRVDG